MNLKRVVSLTAVVVALLLAGAPARAQSCNLPPQSCSGTPPTFSCSGGCAGPVAVANAFQDPCATAGGWDLRGTQYELACASASGCTIPSTLPPMRFWRFNNYDQANIGCQLRNASAINFMSNSTFDPPLAPAFGVAGVWILYQANWLGGPSSAIDGCPGPHDRTAVEISDVLSANEGTTGHSAWYAVGSAAFQPGLGYDLDAISQRCTASGCGPNPGPAGCATAATVPTTPVPQPGIQRRTEACAGLGGRRTQMPLDAGLPTPATATHFVVTITLPGAAAVPWFSDSAAAPPLVGNGTGPAAGGIEIMYRQVPVGAGNEPISSQPAGWLPVEDPANLGSPLGPVSPGATSVVVAVPTVVPSDDYYFATRVVYADATLPGQIFSEVSAHCGPAFYFDVAVSYDLVEAVRQRDGSVVVQWRTISEEDSNNFVVFRARSADGTEAVVEAGAVEASNNPAGASYQVVDRTAARGIAYFYYVQEFTSNGAGDRSVVVPVREEAAGSVGGRARRRALRQR